MKILKTLLAFLLRKLSEKTTWAGLGALLAALGFIVDPEVAAMIAAVCASLAGAALVYVKDAKPNPE